MLTSAYLSQHLARHCCSELPKLLDGFVTHFSKHLSLTVCSAGMTSEVVRHISEQLQGNSINLLLTE